MTHKSMYRIGIVTRLVFSIAFGYLGAWLIMRFAFRISPTFGRMSALVWGTGCLLSPIINDLKLSIEKLQIRDDIERKHIKTFIRKSMKDTDQEKPHDQTDT